MNKAKRLIVAAGALAVLILAGCNPDYVESLNLPPELPFGTIISSSNTSSGYSVHSFVLEWKRGSQALPFVEVDPIAVEKTTFAVLEQLYEKWSEYTSLIDPKPFYDKDKDGTAAGGPITSDPYEVFVYERTTDIIGHLNNANPTDNGPIVIHRYWPKLMKPTVAMWYYAVATRKMAFKKAAAEIEGMIDSIKAHPLYTAGPKMTVHDNTGVAIVVDNPLYNLVPKMEEVIAFNPPLELCVQRSGFDIPGSGLFRKVTLPTDRTGPLYEYYLGYVPYLGDYLDQNDHFAFPGTTYKP
ncbi:hypothetical protein AGMMS49944_17930 [Spirochaetia bacterium]|nr:hypothetical protein AGMMS49944_17930 [Spirochaetia bacterium]